MAANEIDVLRSYAREISAARQTFEQNDVLNSALHHHIQK